MKLGLGYVWIRLGFGWFNLPLKYGLQLGCVVAEAGAGPTFTYSCLKGWAGAGAGTTL